MNFYMYDVNDEAAASSPMNNNTGVGDTMIGYEEGEETVADVLLEIENVRVTEIISGKRTLSVESSTLLVLSMIPTAEDLATANSNLGLPPNTITSDAGDTGKPFVFVLVGDYKLPLGPYIPALQFSRHIFKFVVGSSFVEIELPHEAHSEDVDAFPFIIGTYGTIRVHPKFSGESAAQTDRTQKRVVGLADPVADLPLAATSSAPVTSKADAAGAHCVGGERSLPLLGSMSVSSAASPHRYVNSPPHANARTPNDEILYHSPPSSSSAAATSAAAGAVVSVGGTYTVSPSAYAYNYGEYAVSGVSSASATSGGGNSQLIVVGNSYDAQHQHTVTKKKKPLSTRIAAGISGVGVVAASVVATGSSVFASSIHAGANLFVRKTRPCQQPLNVPPRIKNRLETTRKLTKGAAVVTGAVASSAISVAAVVGTAIGSGAVDMLSGNGKSSNNGSQAAGESGGNEKGKAVLEVGSALFTTGATVFSSLLDAKTTILTATGDNITKVVTHKLGAEAGAVSGNAVGIAGDAIAASTGMKAGFKKSVALAAAKTAVQHQQQLLLTEQQQQQQQGQTQQQYSNY